VSYSSFSQIDTQKKDSLVILSERQAKLVAIDLVKYDSCKELLKEQDSRIANFKSIVTNLEGQLSIKNEVLLEKDLYIEAQDKLLNKPKKIELHGYAGIRSNGLSILNPSIYGNLLLEYSKWSTGLNYSVSSQEKAIWGIVVQYKLF
jgi:hypothetical protein